MGKKVAGMNSKEFEFENSFKKKKEGGRGNEGFSKEKKLDLRLGVSANSRHEYL